MNSTKQTTTTATLNKKQKNIENEKWKKTK